MREILGKLNRSKSQQLVTDSRYRCSHLDPDRGLKVTRSVLFTFDRGYAGEDCYSELRRIRLPRTPLNRASSAGIDNGCCEAYIPTSDNRNAYDAESPGGAGGRRTHPGPTRSSG
jgi:hypothetical protein